MWPFTSGARPDREKIAQLEERVTKLEKLELEWLEWYDKFRRLYARIAKRTEELHKLEAPNESVDPDRPVVDQVVDLPTRAARHRHVNRGF